MRVLTIGDRERAADLGSGGGAFAAYVDGECVVDVWAGVAGAGCPWAEDTRAVIMSATKGLTALCAHVLYDRGELDIDAPVARYWPEFGAAGKERTLVRHLLEPSVGRHRRSRCRPPAVVGRHGLERHDRDRLGHCGGAARMGAGHEARLPRRDVRLAHR